jgi:hypothetical protein
MKVMRGFVRESRSRSMEGAGTVAGAEGETRVDMRS